MDCFPQGSKKGHTVALEVEKAHDAQFAQYLVAANLP